MIVANVDSIVAADQIDRLEETNILYTFLILVPKTVARTSSATTIMFHRRSCVRVQPHRRSCQPDKPRKRNGKALQEGPSPHASRSSWYTQPCNKAHRWRVGHESFDLASVLLNMPHDEENLILANGILNG
jgi:hypothetical protein